jgi:hypothetical protein
MNVIETLNEELRRLLQGNQLYEDYIDQWKFLLESFVGGREYRDGNHLTRYQLETDAEYAARIRTTPLQNHCASVIQIYNSFLFRQSPERDFSLNGQQELVEMTLRDADFDGRSLDAFMKEAATWASVFGHSWIIVSKPNVGAVTQADEQALGVRPYLSVLTPMVVLDWQYQRQPNGSMELVLLRYLEDVTGDSRTVRVWTKESITTTTIDVKKGYIETELIEPNQLGRIPAVCVYNGRSIVRGFGISDIADTAYVQKFIYNCLSEVEQTIRMDSHPSLVVTPETNVGTGSGAIIHMPENLDPGLKPYLLEFTGAEVNNILTTIDRAVDSIDRMSNTGSIRMTEARRQTAAAQEQEFQMLNARLSEKADNLELAEEQMWQFWFAYQGETWMGSVEYPNSFNIRDEQMEISQLQQARSAATDPAVLREIDKKILEFLGVEPEAVFAYEDIKPEQGRTYPDGESIPESLPPAYQDSASPDVPGEQKCANCNYYVATESYCNKFDALVRPIYWCASWEQKEEE